MLENVLLQKLAELLHEVSGTEGNVDANVVDKVLKTEYMVCMSYHYI